MSMASQHICSHAPVMTGISSSGLARTKFILPHDARPKALCFLKPAQHSCIMHSRMASTSCPPHPPISLNNCVSPLRDHPLQTIPPPPTPHLPSLPTHVKAQRQMCASPSRASVSQSPHHPQPPSPRQPHRTRPQARSHTQVLPHASPLAPHKPSPPRQPAAPKP